MKSFFTVSALDDDYYSHEQEKKRKKGGGGTGWWNERRRTPEHRELPESGERLELDWNYPFPQTGTKRNALCLPFFLSLSF